jgi:hypothetical protein
MPSTLVVVIERGLIRVPQGDEHLVRPVDGRYVCTLGDHAGEPCRHAGLVRADTTKHG